MKATFRCDRCSTSWRGESDRCWSCHHRGTVGILPWQRNAAEYASSPWMFSPGAAEALLESDLGAP